MQCCAVRCCAMLFCILPAAHEVEFISSPHDMSEDSCRVNRLQISGLTDRAALRIPAQSTQSSTPADSLTVAHKEDLAQQQRGGRGEGGGLVDHVHDREDKAEGEEAGIGDSSVLSSHIEGFIDIQETGGREGSAESVQARDAEVDSVFDLLVACAFELETATDQLNPRGDDEVGQVLGAHGLG